ncbi:MAG: hypothetical protein L0220_00550 [Acidobacteria bacterium]|nr:hypothetical protein [Acidobacteriota bacterium]
MTSRLAYYHTIINQESFYEAAETLLSEISNLSELAICAELLRQREPGGTYYRAVLWARVMDLLTDKEQEEKVQWSRLRGIGTEIGIEGAKAKEFVLLGRAIRDAEKELASPLSLRKFPPELFSFAQRQKDRAKNYLVEAARILSSNPTARPSQVHLNWCHLYGSQAANLDIIKPSDWWAFSHPKWRQEKDFPGSTPGEVYANALYYFAPQRGIAVDPMAGSGMLRRVYLDRARWQKNLSFKLELHLFDLYPCRKFIKKHDASKPLPVKADWIFIDPPYFGQSRHLYQGELAQAISYPQYLKAMKNVICVLAGSLNKEGRLCILLPKWSGLRPEDPNYDLPSDVKDIALKAGLRWIDTAYVSRARQQEAGSAMKNNAAKRNRRMRSDVCVLNVFEK